MKLPCEDCITLAICKSRFNDELYNPTYVNSNNTKLDNLNNSIMLLINKCSIIRSFICFCPQDYYLLSSSKIKIIEKFYIKGVSN